MYVPPSSKDARPTWTHSSLLFGPMPGPPSPTQAATWPFVTVGVERRLTVAATPCALVRACKPAYAYAAPEQAAFAAPGAAARRAIAARRFRQARRTGTGLCFDAGRLPPTSLERVRRR